MKIRASHPAVNPLTSKPSKPSTASAAHTAAHTAREVAQAENPADQFQQILNGKAPKALSTVAFAAEVEQVTPKDWGDVTVADRQGNMKALQTLAHRLRDQGMPGVEIWGALRAEAVSRYADKQVSPQRQADFVMQDMALLTVGKDALKYLDQYTDIPRISQMDPLVEIFQSDWQAMGVPPADGDWKAAGWAGNDLDTHTGSDFRPEINDKTKNQIFHTMFYEFMGYVTQDDLMIRAGSMVHELRDGVADGGISPEDHNASYAGTAVGKTFRQMRDGAHTAAALKQWSGLTMAAYGKGGGPEVRSGQASPEAQQMHKQMSRKLEDKSLTWKVENLLIQGVDQLNDGVQRLRDLF